MRHMYRLGEQISQANRATNSLCMGHRLRYYSLFQSLLFCMIIILLTACDSNANTSSRNSPKQTLSSSNGSTITYATGPQDVLIRTFYGVANWEGCFS